MIKRSYTSGDVVASAVPWLDGDSELEVMTILFTLSFSGLLVSVSSDRFVLFESIIFNGGVSCRFNCDCEVGFGERVFDKL